MLKRAYYLVIKMCNSFLLQLDIESGFFMYGIFVRKSVLLNFIAP